jgi:putative SOS response-associated peptidase YedK
MSLDTAGLPSDVVDCKAGQNCDEAQVRLIIAPRSTAAQHRPAEWGRLRRETINPPGRQLARKSAECPWRQLGLVPGWANDPSVAARMINARSETASTKPGFSDALKFRRCLVPADGFYEWQKTGKAEQPYCFEISDRAAQFLRYKSVHSSVIVVALKTRVWPAR